MTATAATEAVARDTATAISLRDTLAGNGWMAESPPAGGGLAAIESAMRPIDALAGAGHGWLTSYVEPLQGVVDRMTGKAGVIQTFADGWQRAAAAVEQVQQQLGQAVATDTAQWRGAAGDAYRGRATEVGTALRGLAALATATGSAARTMGEATAGARQSAGDLLADLVRRLISYVSQAKAVEGGITSSVVAQATTLISSYQAPISDIEQRLRETLANAERQLNGTVQVASVGGNPGIGASVLSTWGSLRQRLERRGTTRGITLAQSGPPIQLPPPSLPPGARPLSKADLERMAQNPIFYGRLGLRVTLGDYVEDAARAALGFDSNTRRLYPYNDRRRWVIPDGVQDREQVDVTVDQRGIPIRTETHTVRDGVILEVKATSDTVSLDTPREQMRKYIDFLARAHADALASDPNAPAPWLVYAATTETQLDPASVAYAQSRGIAVWRAQLYMSGPDTDPLISVGPPQPMNAVAREEGANGIGPPGSRTPAPLFSSPYDELLRRRILQEEQN